MAWKNTKGMPTITRARHVIDVTDVPVGRAATMIAKLLMGKHKATYVPHIDGGDFVEVTNVLKIKLTGKKWDQKMHYRSSDRPGGVKSISMRRLKEEKPERILEHAVKYMLPKNKQQTERMKRLIIKK